MASEMQKLPTHVIDRIAAGEVVQRPMNVVKELLENSLDAGATEIVVSIRNGGLEMIRVEDNGRGIASNELANACERYTTSKLRQFEDLQSIRTFGFRGEALASISQVAHVTITSKTCTTNCAYKCKYLLCKPIDIARPSAGNDGTVITVEDLFYNCPAKRKNFKYTNDEAHRIANAIMCFAIANSGVAFAFHSAINGKDFRTVGDGNQKSVIAALVGADIANTLIPITANDKQLHYSLNGYIARPLPSNTSKRQSIFVLFINGRAVDCPDMKKAIEFVFATQKLSCSFVLLFLEIEPNRVDVNVHPTKQIVYFLDQKEIIVSLQQIIETTLNDQIQCVNRTSISIAPTVTKPIIEFLVRETDKDISLSTDDRRTKGANVDNKRVYAHNVVRTDSKERKLDEFMNLSQTSDQPVEGDVHTVFVGHFPSPSAAVVRLSPAIGTNADDVDRDLEHVFENVSRTPTWRDFRLESIDNLRKRIRQQTCPKLRQLFKSHTFVGCISPTVAVIQHGTQLYAVDVQRCTQHLFYQIAIFCFGNFGSFKLTEHAPISDLFKLSDQNLTDEDGEKCIAFLQSHDAMLLDYFALTIVDGDLITIPSLIAGFVPQLEGLPQLIADFVYAVDWNDETQCLHDICMALSRFFVIKPQYCIDALSSNMKASKYWMEMIQFVLFPAFKSKLFPPVDFTNSIRRLTDVPSLYKVFERC